MLQTHNTDKVAPSLLRPSMKTSLQLRVESTYGNIKFPWKTNIHTHTWNGCSYVCSSEFSFNLLHGELVSESRMSINYPQQQQIRLHFFVVFFLFYEWNSLGDLEILSSISCCTAFFISSPHISIIWPIRIGFEDELVGERMWEC